MPAASPRWAGIALLISIAIWWTGLRLWAEAQVGYLDIDTLGAAPFAWIVLLAIAGVALVTGLLPRQGDRPANIVCTALFLVVAGALAVVNVAYGADDGISAAGWLMAALSLGQIVVFVGAMAAGQRAEPVASST